MSHQDNRGQRLDLPGVFLEGLARVESWIHQKCDIFKKPKFSVITNSKLILSVVKRQLKMAMRWLFPKSIRKKLRRSTRRPTVGGIDFGDLRQLSPISDNWGFDRGSPIDRYYIEKFLSANLSDIQGQVLEIGVDTYTVRFGGDNVTKSDVLHVTEGNPKATIVADLTCAEHIPSDTFDCIICTQTLHLIYSVKKAIATLNRILKPGGILLATTPGITRISRYDMDRLGDHWRFTSASMQRILENAFPRENINIEAYGNVLAAIGFLHGLSYEELSPEELDHLDPDYEVLISIRATKSKK